MSPFEERTAGRFSLHWPRNGLISLMPPARRSTLYQSNQCDPGENHSEEGGCSTASIMPGQARYMQRPSTNLPEGLCLDLLALFQLNFDDK